MTAEGLYFDDATFERIRSYVYDLTGIMYTDGRRAVLDRRIRARLQETGCSDGASYLAFLQSDDAGTREVDALIDLVTTNETSFFRHEQQFRIFTDIASGLIAAPLGGDRVRLWSAACSSGEEPYSLAMVMHRTLAGMATPRVAVYGTDISPPEIERARAGVYAERQVRGLPETYLMEYTTSAPRDSDQVLIDARIRDMVTFETASLLDPRAQTWGRMDVIFCRNVLIYFDDAAKRKVLESLWEGLLPGGYLVLGPSDSLFGITDAFQRTPHSAYNFFQRPADSAGPRVAVSHEREKTPAPNTDTGPTTPSADDEAAAATPGAAPVIGDALRFKLLITRLDAGLRDLGRDVTNSVDRSVEAVTAVEELLSRSKDRDEETLRQLRLEVASARRQLARMLVYLQVADRSEQKLEALRALLQELSDRLLGTAAEAPDLGVRTTSFDPAMLRSGEQDDDADDSEAMSQDDIDTLFD